MDTVNPAPEERQNQRATRERRRQNNLLLGFLAFLLTIGAWGGAAYYSFVYARDYLEETISNVRQENAVNLQELTASISQLTNEINELRENIEDTDSAVSKSTSVQKRIDDKLEALDRQLQELEESLAILREAPNVQP